MVMAGVLLAGGAVAQTAPNRYVFTTVDAVDLNSITLTVTGVLEGESAPSSHSVYFVSSAPLGDAQLSGCERKALLAMSKPGQYTFSITQLTQYGVSCKLARVAP
jgi:hypothetical protein